MQFTMNGSKADTGKSYAVGQARIKGGQLHMQFGGTGGNRDYGFAGRFELPDGVCEFLKANPGTLNSFASGSQVKYVPVQVRTVFLDGEPYLHAQFTGVCGNRDYGLSCNIPLPEKFEDYFESTEIDEEVCF